MMRKSTFLWLVQNNLIHLYNTNTNTERYATSDMAHAEKTALAEQRAEKKAARRAAFIQEVAEAVYSLGVQRQNEIHTKQQEQSQAARAARVAQQTAERAQYDAEHPIEAAMYRQHPGYRESLVLRSRLPELTLKWAIDSAILPPDAREIPDKEAQYIALARAGR